MIFIYPDSFQLTEIQQLYMAKGREGRVGLDLCPDQPVNAGQVRWEQEDNYYGLQQLRGMDGAPNRVVSVGRNVYFYDPGVYGEYEDIKEMELTNRSAGVGINTPINVTDLVEQRMRMLVTRQFDRKEYNFWQVALNGTISITIGDPVTGTQVGYKDSYPIQTSTGTAPWATTATATPIKDMQVVQQLGVGYSVDLGAGADAWMNAQTMYNMLNNSNAADFAGRRDSFGATLNNIGQVQNYFQAQNLPRPRVYDGGYFPNLGGNTTGAFTRFIPTGKVLIVGKRPGNVPVAQYQITRNAYAGYQPAPYSFIKDFTTGMNCAKDVGKGIEVHMGHNGGVAVKYPSAMVVLSV